MVFGFFKKKKKDESPIVTEESREEVLASAEQTTPSVVDDTYAEPLKLPNEEVVLSESLHVHEVVVQSATQTGEGVIGADTTASEPALIDEIDTTLVVPNGVTNEQADDSFQNSETVSESNNPPRKMSWSERLKHGLSKTRTVLGKKLLGVFGGGKIDDDLYEELESILLTSDVGVPATLHLLEDVRQKVSIRGLKDSSELKRALSDGLIELIAPLEKPLETGTHTPFVIMMVGVNGAGKTTSIGKLAKYFQQQGKSVMLAAGDTFRAAAREQLLEWGKRNDVTVITQQSGDSAAVCYDAIQSAIAKKIDIVLADTAGRLPTQLNLMEEIKKVKRVIDKALPGAPHEVMLVLDANIGQNAINQVKAFDDALGLTGLVLTKLDGTAKGGVICAIAKERPVPLRFIGVGEGIDDLRPFTCKEYIEALLG